MQYQYDFTRNPVAKEKMYDGAGRTRKAEKMIAVLQDYLGETSALSILDVSCSTGIICDALSDHFYKVTGIDIDQEAVAHARSRHAAKNLEFHVMNALRTSFPDGSFDVVVCNQMYEHVPDAYQLLQEIYRVLVPGGVCYFGAANRLKVIETHYGRLPFLSYLPKPLAHLYLRILGRGKYYYETHYLYGTLKRLCANFERIDYTVKVVQDPEKFRATDMIATGTMSQRLALVVLKLAYWAFPGYIWLLKKPEGK